MSSPRRARRPSRLVYLAPAVLAVLVLALPARSRAASLPAGGVASKASKAATSGTKSGTKTIGKPAKASNRYPTVVLYHVNRRETLRLRLYDERGRSVRGIQRQVDQFLRCHYTGRRYPMNARLTRLIYEVGKHYPGRRIEVVSGYRHPKFAKNPRSPHMRGLATDLRVTGIKNTELRDLLRSRFKSVGVGYYPNSSFVHLDVRRGASAFWIDYSGPGESAQYAANAAEDLRNGRAERYRRTTIDPAWADSEDAVAELGAPATPATTLAPAVEQTGVD